MIKPRHDQYPTLFVAEGFEPRQIDTDTADFRVLSREGDHLVVSYHSKTYRALIKSWDIQSKKAVINVSGYDFNISILEPIDRLMDSMGFLTASKSMAKEIKSPMPGLIRSIFVEVGEAVEEGQKLLSLEAMKMENIIKATGTGTVSQVLISSGQAVDKNQVLIIFE
jgi:biotin carboxyl carrier protein